MCFGFCAHNASHAATCAVISFALVCAISVALWVAVGCYIAATLFFFFFFFFVFAL
jgi:hypothetical protein